MPDPRITLRTAYATLKDNFTDSHVFRSAGNALQVPHNNYPFSALDTLVPLVGEHAVVIYFGPIGNDLRYGFRIVEMKTTEDPDVFDLDPVLGSGAGSTPSHILDQGAFVPVGSFSAPWSDMHAAYYEDVLVDRTGNGKFAALDPTEDPKAISMPWNDELRALWVDNQRVIGERAARIVISSLARFHTGSIGYNGADGFRHCVGFHVQVNDRGAWVDLLDDSAPDSYTNHGADFGNLCPPVCADYTTPN